MDASGWGEPSPGTVKRNGYTGAVIVEQIIADTHTYLLAMGCVLLTFPACSSETFPQAQTCGYSVLGGENSRAAHGPPIACWESPQIRISANAACSSPTGRDTTAKFSGHAFSSLGITPIF